VSEPRSARRGLFLLLLTVPAWLKTAWWGLVSAQVGRRVEIVQAAVMRGESAILLSRRVDLRGWELPGGNVELGETGEEALRREVREETGLEVAIEGVVGSYHRTGFLPHRMRLYRCRAIGGALAPSDETPDVAYFDVAALPRHALLPWCRQPLADALAWRPNTPEVERHESQGLREILESARIDLTARLRGE
jgi:8-oxo-dGTP diphosphatase